MRDVGPHAGGALAARRFFSFQPCRLQFGSWRFVTLIDPGVTVGDAAAGGW